MKTILIHGPAGCGKDTQVDLILAKYPTFQKIGTGEMFRTMLTERTPLHPEADDAHEYWSKGKPVPSVLTYSMLEYWLRHRYDPSKDWIFVSTVRAPEQVQLLDELLQIFDRKLDKFIHLTLSEKLVVERLSLRKYCPKCQSTYHPQFKKELVEGFCDKDGAILIQREDDKPEKIKIRLKEQYEDTIGSIERLYADRGIMVRIDASPSIEEIRQNIWNELGLQ
jgi:adenylate kinase